MIITRTPFRVSFAGGGSDLASFYSKHEGAVVSTCINKYMYITIHPRFDKTETTIKYSKTETVNNIRQLHHPIARQVLLDNNLQGVELTSVADIPSGTGLASSSAYTVGMLHTVNAYLGKYKSQEWMAEQACDVEIEKLGEPIGKQDQYGVAIGGLKYMRFLPSGDVDVTPILLSESCEKTLEENLLMFYTGAVRSASTILEEQNDNITQDDKFQAMVEIVGLAKLLQESLVDEDLDAFGKILHQGWLLKRKMASQISNPHIDKYYDLAIKNGATGGKLLGAGGGGFLLFYCEPEHQKRLRAALSDLEEMPFRFDHAGTKIIYVGNKDWD